MGRAARSHASRSAPTPRTLRRPGSQTPGDQPKRVEYAPMHCAARRYRTGENARRYGERVPQGFDP
jgi:hypothetical protein